MLVFTKLVTVLVFCLLTGSLFGAFMADRRGHNAFICAAIGGLAGVLFGLIACSEMEGGNLFDVLFPPRGAVRCSCCDRRAPQSVDPCDCAASFCVRCLMCKAHCECADAESIISAQGWDARHDIVDSNYQTDKHDRELQLHSPPRAGRGRHHPGGPLLVQVL
jgi:hypothetical protein